MDPEILSVQRDLTLAEILRCEVSRVDDYPARYCDLALAVNNARIEAQAEVADRQARRGR